MTVAAVTVSINGVCGPAARRKSYDYIIWIHGHFNQGGPGIAKKDPGSFFTEMTFGLELTKYVSGRLSIYGNGISIFV